MVFLQNERKMAMKYHLKTIMLAGWLLFIPRILCAECAQFQIIDHGDRVEAVCVGQPLTTTEIIELNKQKEQEHLAAQEQKAQQEREEIKQKLSKVECTDIPGECGPGRGCFSLITAFGVLKTCKTKDDANRTLDKIKDKQREIARDTAENFKNMQRDNERTIKDNERAFKDRQRDQKIDNIERKLRYGY